MLKYIELKTGYSDDGPAWIGRVKMSRSGRTVYFIEAAAVDEYLRLVDASELDRSRFVVSNAFQPADPSKFYDLENKKLQTDQSEEEFWNELVAIFNRSETPSTPQ